MITAMNASTAALIVLVVIAMAAYAVYLTSVIKGDGLNLRGHQPPASHYPDLFDASAGLSRLA